MVGVAYDPIITPIARIGLLNRAGSIRTKKLKYLYKRFEFFYTVGLRLVNAHCQWNREFWMQLPEDFLHCTKLGV